MTPTANPVTQAAFDAAYWASFPPAVAALQSMQVDVEISPAPPNGRTQTAINLAKQGFVIDTETMVYGWGPYLMMSDRQAFGFTWVPSLLQAPPTIAPGVNDPGVAAYNPNNPPAGSIKVSTNLADYPPYATPAPVPTVTDLVGAQMAWVLRPFVGSPSQPFQWFRVRESSFFEAVWQAIRTLLS